MGDNREENKYGGMALAEYEIDIVERACLKCGGKTLYVLRPIDFMFYTLPVFHICPFCLDFRQVAVGDVPFHDSKLLLKESKIDKPKGGSHESSG